MDIDAIENLLNGFGKISISRFKQATEEIAEYMVREKIIVFCNGVPYTHYDNYYRCIIEEDIPMIILNLVEDSDRIKLKSTIPQEVYKRLKYDMRLQVDIIGGLYKSREYLNLNNGIFNIRTGRIESNRKDLIFDYKLNCSYYPYMSIDRTTAFKNYIKTSIGENGCECLLRSTGYCLSSLTNGRAATILQGCGQSGKSVWLGLLENIVDPTLRSCVSFHDMTKQEYLIKLMGKRINICTDENSGVIKNEGIFKRITSSEEVTARDLFSSPVTFRPTVKLIASTNSELNFQHLDNEILDRLIVIPFQTAIKEKDPQLLEKLINEKDIICSLAFDSLKRLVDDNFNFNMSNDGKNYIHHKRKELNPEKSFIEQMLIVDSKGEISSLDLWNKFKKWCFENVIEHMGQRHFLKSIKDYDPSIVKTMIGPATKRINGFKGIRFKVDTDYSEAENQ